MASWLMHGWDWWQYAVVLVLGIAAGVVNMMAGGGSNLILPVLIMFGIPANIANGTNRVGVLIQSFSGLHGFARAGKLPTDDLPAILIPLLIGGLFGALAAAFVPVVVLKPLLLIAMLSVAALTLFKPSVFVHRSDECPLKVSGSPKARWGLLGAGAYGGFVQAGTGFVLLPVLAGLLRYDLARANALKVCGTLGFTVVSLAVFLWQGQVWWDVGLVLAAGNSIGARFGVKAAVAVKPEVMRILLFVMTLAAVIGTLIF